MIGAIVKDNVVENLIVLSAEKVDAMEIALDCEIVDARPYGLAVGDLRTKKGWTRNAGGEQMILPLLDAVNYDSYSVAVRKMKEAEEQVAYAGEAAVDEAIAILTGEVE